MGFPGPLAPLVLPAWVFELAEKIADPEKVRQREVASFRPGDGLKIVGSLNAQKRFATMVRREMRRSPTFHALMLEINADKAHPVTVTLGWKQPGVFVDSFDSQGYGQFGRFEYPGQQELDLFDFSQLPVDAPADHPHAITQGELLVHAMAEARKGALGDAYRDSHLAGIEAQNDYRDERGQQGHRRPDDDGDYNRAGNWSMTYDNGHNEVWVMEGKDIKEINRSP